MTGCSEAGLQSNSSLTRMVSQPVEEEVAAQHEFISMLEPAGDEVNMGRNMKLRSHLERATMNKYLTNIQLV
jgi:hypothetical protein